MITATKEHLEYLDRLCASGVTNMLGAIPYIEAEFGLERRDAAEVLKQWMASFYGAHEESFTERMKRGKVTA